jgi:hypothetical protein
MDRLEPDRRSTPAHSNYGKDLDQNIDPKGKEVI